MGFLTWIVVGLVAGWLAGQVMKGGGYGVLVDILLGMLGGAPVSVLGVDSPPYLARLIEVMREGFIDRAQYADPDFVRVPIDVLLSQRHIDEALRRALHRHHRRQLHHQP